MKNSSMANCYSILKLWFLSAFMRDAFIKRHTLLNDMGERSSYYITMRFNFITLMQNVFQFYDISNVFKFCL